MTSRSLVAATTVVLIALAGCIGSVQPPAVAGAASGGNATVQVSATGQVSVDPDLALVRVAVVAEADTAEGAREAVARDVERMRGALRDAGVPDDAVRTTSFHLSAVYASRDDDREIVGYAATHGFEVETGVDRPGEVIDVAVSNGATRVDGVTFTLADETRRAARTDAIALAMSNARADADAIATAADLEVVGVSAASTGGGGFVPVPADLERADAGGATTIEPGPVTVTATVEVTYGAE